MCYICCSMNVVIVPEEVSAKDETRWKNEQKVIRARSLSLCCSLVSVKKDKERINLVHFRNVEEEFRSRNQIKTSRNS